jgi:hypothetical protein
MTNKLAKAAEPACVVDKTMSRTPAQKKVAGAVKATEAAQRHVGQALDLLQRGPINRYGVYNDPSNERAKMHAAKDAIDAALAVMTETAWPTESDFDPPRPDDKEMAAKIKKWKERHHARIAEIKRELAQWIDQKLPLADHGAASTALLELAFDQYIALHGEVDAADLIHRAYRRTVQERSGNGTLQ